MRNLALLDRNIVIVMDSGRRVDYSTAFENQIVHG
jgi:hypothetical protein